MKKSKSLWIDEFNSKWNNYYNYSLVDNSIQWNRKVRIICPIHGEFEQTPNSHIKSGCPKCGRIRSNKAKLEKGRNNFLIYGKSQKYDYSKAEYINSKTKVCIICPKHGEFWLTPNNHMHGLGCPKCSEESVKSKLTKTQELFILEARLVHGDFYDYSKSVYTGINNKITITCPIHGDFETTPHVHILDKCKCPKCSANKKELDLYLSLKKYFSNIEFKFHYSPSWLGTQVFDIYVPNLNLAIEYDGILHYKAVKHFGGYEKFEYQKVLDTQKQELCNQNNCILFRIPYNFTIENIIDLILNIKQICYQKKINIKDGE